MATTKKTVKTAAKKRAAGGAAPAAGRKPVAAKKAAAKNVAAKKAVAKKTPSPKAAAGKAAAKKVAAKKSVAKKSVAKKSVAPRVALAKTIARKPVATKAVARKVAVSKVAVSKVAVSKVAVPKVAVPKVAVSKVAVPKVAVPKVAVPKVAVPKVAVPKVAVPKVAVPKSGAAPAAARKVPAAARPIDIRIKVTRFAHPPAAPAAKPAAAPAAKPAAPVPAKATAPAATAPVRPAKPARAVAPRKAATTAPSLEPAPLTIETEDPRLRHAGQVASERARYDLGPHGKVIGEGLGALPPGYDLTFVRGLIRDPNHLVAVWDINDEVALAAAESIGWDRVGLRVLDESGRVLVHELVGGRGGTYHLRVGRPGRTVRVAVGLDRSDGFFLTLARSAPVRMPADAPAGTFEPYQEIRIPARLDRRTLLRAEPPARPGQRGPRRSAPAARLHERLLLALRALPGDFWISKDHELWRAFALSETARERAAEEWPEAFHQDGAPDGAAPGAEGGGPGEPITSPAGWSASGPVEEAPTSPGGAGRWPSGAGRDGR